MQAVSITPAHFQTELDQKALRLLEEHQPVVFFRDPMVLIKEWFSSEELAAHLITAPSIMTDTRTDERAYGDFDTGKHWHALQVNTNGVVRLI